MHQLSKEKAYVGSLCNLSLLLSNTTLMRQVIDDGPEARDYYKYVLLLAVIHVSIACQVTFALMHAYIDHLLAKKIKEGDKLLEQMDNEQDTCTKTYEKDQKKSEIGNLNLRHKRLSFICVVLVLLVFFSNIYIAAFDHVSKNDNSDAIYGNGNNTHDILID